jgi:ribulose-phosphate 3-epimerase
LKRDGGPEVIEIIPAILTDNVADFEERIRAIGEAVDVNGANIKRVQIDIIDGDFADNKTIDPANIVGTDTNLSLDFHLMVKEPINWIEKCANAGADRIIGQIEKMDSQVDFVGKVQETGLYVGLAVDLETPVANLDPTILTNVDVVLLMAVKAGWGGQKFDTRVLAKIKELDEIRVRDSTPFKICVDGGETEEVIDDTHFAGADEVVVGKRLFQGSLADNINRLQVAAYGRK